jgi:hypothetical protein
MLRASATCHSLDLSARLPESEKVALIPRLRQEELPAAVSYGAHLTWSKRSRGVARLMGCPLGLEQRSARSSDGGSD